MLKRSQPMLSPEGSPGLLKEGTLPVISHMCHIKVGSDSSLKDTDLGILQKRPMGHTYYWFQRGPLERWLTYCFAALVVSWCSVTFSSSWRLLGWIPLEVVHWSLLFCPFLFLQVPQYISSIVFQSLSNGSLLRMII